MKFTCAECGARIEATERFFGRDVGCPTCGQMIHVPLPEENTGVSTVAGPAPAVKTPAPANPPSTPTPAKTPPAPAAAQPAAPPIHVPGAPLPVVYPPSRQRGGGVFGKVLVTGLALAAVGYGLSRRATKEQTTATQPALTDNAAAQPTVAPTPLEPLPISTEIPGLALEPAASSEPTPAPDTTPAPVATPFVIPTPAPPVAMGTPPPTPAPSTLPAAQPTPARVVSYFGTSEPPSYEDEPPDTPPPAPFPAASGTMMSMNISDPAQASETLFNRRVTMSGAGTLRLTGAGDPLPGSVLNFTSPDAWLLLEKIPAAEAVDTLLKKLWINGTPAAPGVNVRVARYGGGCLVIPQGLGFAAMQAFGGVSLSGPSMPLRCGVKYGPEALDASKMNVGSFRLKRGYMATIAQEENGTGISRNYVAQDRDLEIKQLPAEMDGKVRFMRVFPWRWTDKKGVAGGIHQNLRVGWFYNWNISENSRPELEYVPIRQGQWWPGLDQDWIARGATHLLGFNEPDHKDQSNLSVDDAIRAWPPLLSTGLRLGSPAVSDGGLGWLYDFMAKADAAHLRVDFVAVHYYRAIGDPNDARGAANQLYNFVKGIHERTKRPIWVTEWNNGANWTGHKPNYQQEKAAVAAMIDMLDRTPFVERYAIYNWVEDERNVQRKDGSLTPAGEVYRDKVAPLSYVQAAP